MKRRPIVFVLLCMFLLSSCRVYGTGIPHEKWIMEDNSSVENALMEQVAECLQKQDADGLKKVFSKQALQEADDIDAQIKRLFQFFQGEDISWEEECLETSEDSNKGKRKKEVFVWYWVSTDQEEYCVFFYDYPIDTQDKDNQGLYAMRVVKKEDEKTKMGTRQEMRIPGIYIPEDDTASS